jgi:penicillin-binding protein 2
MRNSPLNSIFEDALNDDEADLIASGSPVRLGLIAAVFITMSLVIVLRIAWVQTRLTERYLGALEQTSTEYEILPARDGRILADTMVLAADEERYTLQIHYRWLQQTPDPQWVAFQLRQRLSRTERRIPELVSKTEAKIIQEHQKLHENLRQLNVLSDTEYSARRNALEQRISKIADAVNKRHSGLHPISEESADGSILVRCVSSIRRALTTPPTRPADERIIIKEEEEFHTLADNLPLKVAAYISEHPEQFPGARITSATRRNYPQHQLAAHVVGARTSLSDAQRAALLATATNDANSNDANANDLNQTDATLSNDANLPPALPERQGRFGVELSYDSRLGGKPGLRRIVRNRRQQIVSSDIVRRPESGRDVVLTIDVGLQEICQELLAEALTDRPRRLLQNSAADETDPAEDSTDNSENPAEERPQPVPSGGSIIVMEADSGRVLAAASGPTFDLSLFTGGSAEAWDAANADRRRPFFARFTGTALPPGSTYKSLTAIAALETKTMNADDSFYCQGYLSRPTEHRCLIFRNYGQGHQEITLATALAQSCNVYFFDAARRMGFGSLRDWSRQLGFGQKTGIDLPFEKTGSLPELPASGTLPAAAAQKRLERESLGFAIGQSRVTVTPLQMARLMALIVNGGWLVTPHVVSDEGVSHRSFEPSASPGHTARVKINGLHEATLQAVRDGLIAAVEQPGGTAFRTARLADVQFGGKTGTAETSGNRPDHAWFAGFAPADDPRYVFVVVLEHGGSGSHAAAPVAREIVRYLMSGPQEPQVSAVP